MTQTYAQLQKQIARLQKEAVSLREKEVHGVVARIKEAIAHYGLTAEQLGFGRGSSEKAKGKASLKTVLAKYADGNGNFWSGMGKRPNWLHEALNAGKTLDELRVGGAAAATKGTKVKAKVVKAAKGAKGAKRKPSQVLFRDGNGNSWTGRGPQPRWLKEALAGGKTLEELKG
jgi:DNA-binding protein H-NS